MCVVSFSPAGHPYVYLRYHSTPPRLAPHPYLARARCIQPNMYDV